MSDRIRDSNRCVAQCHAFMDSTPGDVKRERLVHDLDPLTFRRPFCGRILPGMENSRCSQISERGRWKQSVFEG